MGTVEVSGALEIMKPSILFLKNNLEVNFVGDPQTTTDAKPWEFVRIPDDHAESGIGSIGTHAEGGGVRGLCASLFSVLQTAVQCLKNLIRTMWVIFFGEGSTSPSISSITSTASSSSSSSSSTAVVGNKAGWAAVRRSEQELV